MTLASFRRPETPGSLAASRPALARWYNDARVCVFPPPNCVINVRTGAVFSVLPDRRRSAMPECSVNARVKQVREKNCAGSL